MRARKARIFCVHKTQSPDGCVMIVDNTNYDFTEINNMLSTLIPFLATLMITFTFCILSRRPFGKCIVMTLYFMSVTLYVSQYLARSFQPGFYVLNAAGALAIPLFFMMGGASKNAGYILTGGLWAYIGCLLVVSIMDAGRSLYSWDELMHWGKMVKEMFRLDRFYCVTESTLYRHKDYPPFVAILEYAWCRFGGGYSEPHVAQAVHLLNVSLIVPYLFEQFRARKRSFGAALSGIVKGALAAGILLILCSLCDPNANISSIYEDITIALMFAYSAFLVYRKEYRSVWGTFAYMLSLAALIGTKQIGIAFVGLSLLYLLLSSLFLNEDSKGKRAGILCAAVSAVAAAVYYISWDRKAASYESARQFDLGSNISISAFLKVITDASDRVHRDMLKRFIFALFEKNIAGAPLAVTYFTSFLAVLLLLIALGYVFRDKISMAERIILGIVFTAGEGGYALMMLMLYELAFETQEMNSMHSFVRYMGSYFLAELALLFAIAVWLWGKRSPVFQKTRSMCIAFMLAAVLVVPAKLSFLLPQGILGDRVYDSRQYGSFITEHVKKGSNIYLLYHRTDGDREQITYSYFVDGSWIDHAYYDMSEENLTKLDTGALEDTLRTDDYLFAMEVTDGMNRALSAYNGGKKLKDYTLYEIQKKAGKITLAEVKK